MSAAWRHTAVGLIINRSTKLVNFTAGRRMSSLSFVRMSETSAPCSFVPPTARLAVASFYQVAIERCARVRAVTDRNLIAPYTTSRN